MGLMGVISKLSSVICHESLSGHNISLSCNNMPLCGNNMPLCGNNMPLCGNNMPLLNDYGWLLFTQKVYKKNRPFCVHFADADPQPMPYMFEDVDWETVKNKIKKEVEDYSRNHS